MEYSFVILGLFSLALEDNMPFLIVKVNANIPRHDNAEDLVLNLNSAFINSRTSEEKIDVGLTFSDMFQWRRCR